MGVMENSYNILAWRPEGKRDHSKDLEVDGSITLE
jgi:hypothetical protein